MDLFNRSSPLDIVGEQVGEDRLREGDRETPKEEKEEREPQDVFEEGG